MYNCLYNIRGILIPFKDEPRYVPNYEKLYVISKQGRIFSIKSQKWLTPTRPLIKMNRKILIKKFGLDSQPSWSAAFVDPTAEILVAKRDVLDKLRKKISERKINGNYEWSIYDDMLALIEPYERDSVITLTKNGRKKRFILSRLVYETYKGSCKGVRLTPQHGNNFYIGYSNPITLRSIGITRDEYFNQYMKNYRAQKKREAEQATEM